MLLVGALDRQIHAIRGQHLATVERFNFGGARDQGQCPLLGRMTRVQPGRILLRFDERIVDDRMIGASVR